MVRSSRRSTNPLWTAPTATAIYESELGSPEQPPQPRLNPEIVTLLMLDRSQALACPENDLGPALIANLSFWAGARTSEIFSLDESDFRLSGRHPTVLLPRRGGKVPVEIPAAVAALARRYLGIRLRALNRHTKDERLIKPARRRVNGRPPTLVTPTAGTSLASACVDPPPITLRGIRRAFADMAIGERCQELVLAEQRRRASVVFTPPNKISSADIRAMFSAVRQRIEYIADA